jgi:very-short-patch-repair endonuclease
MAMKYSQIKKFARRLRNNPTPSEALLWKYLKEDRLYNRRFLRQHPIIYESIYQEHFFYIPDFYCASCKLIVELDGRIHDYQADRDRHRDEILHHYGLTVVRIKNEELHDIEKVLEKIKKHANITPPSYL